MPSPESPAKRMTTWSRPSTGCSRAAVSAMRVSVLRGIGKPTVGVYAVVLCNCDCGVEIDVLDRVDELDALLQGPPERLAANDEAGAAGPLVDDGGADGLTEVALALRLAAAVDQRHPAHVAVDDLPAGPFDRVVRHELAVDQRVGLAELDGVEATVVFRLLLLDDVGLDGDAEVVGLAGQVGRQRVVDAVLFEGVVAQIAPQDGEHPEAVGLLEGLAHLL